MKIYNGIIKEISQPEPVRDSGKFKKRVVIEESMGQLSEIEFKGSVLELLEDFRVYDPAIIVAENRGSRNRNSGKFYNNIVAKSIKKQEVCKQL